MGPREVELLKRRVASGEQPWAAAVKKLTADTPVQYRCAARVLLLLPLLLLLLLLLLPLMLLLLF
jgi:hypothetical protein